MKMKKHIIAALITYAIAGGFVALVAALVTKSLQSVLIGVVGVGVVFLIVWGAYLSDITEETP